MILVLQNIFNDFGKRYLSSIFSNSFFFIHISIIILYGALILQIKGFKRSTKDLIMKMKSFGPTSDHTKRISFEALVVFLREKDVIAVSKACLQRIHYLCHFRHGSPPKALAPDNVNVRVFLAGFMIAFRPTHVFESMGTLEQALYEAAMPLIKNFEMICDALMTSKSKSFADVPLELTKDFSTLLFDYLKRFKAWKVPDEAKLTCRIKHALIALYQVNLFNFYLLV